MVMVWFEGSNDRDNVLTVVVLTLYGTLTLYSDNEQDLIFLITLRIHIYDNEKYRIYYILSIELIKRTLVYKWSKAVIITWNIFDNE